MGVIEMRQAADHVAVMTLNRPESRNAMNSEMLDEFTRAMSEQTAAGCRALVITGAGSAFCAGVDLRDTSLVNDPDDPNTLEAGMRTQRRFVAVTEAVRRAPWPVIAAVNGNAVGAGMALALSCDLRIAGPDAAFDSKVLMAGLAGCDLGMSWLLPRMVGMTRAFEILLAGIKVDARTAVEIGLVSRVVPGDDLMTYAVDIGKSIASLDPFNVRMTKEVLWAQLEVGSLAAGIELENRTQLLASLSGRFSSRAETFRK